MNGLEYYEDLYRRYNDRRYAYPDPIVFLYRYADVGDREIVALVASSLAFGRVEQIMKSCEAVFSLMRPTPRKFVVETAPEQLAGVFSGFKHRFATGGDVARLLEGTARALREFGTLEKCFVSGLKSHHRTVIEALCDFTGNLSRLGGDSRNPLLPSPEKGSACKRLNLFLRWMVRNDEIDPGGWSKVPREKLIVPLDTHMHGTALELGLTKRTQADLKTAIDITNSLARFCPEDPVKFDFALTRPGIWANFGERSPRGW